MLGVHPVAALFPMLADDELADMAADIKERGLLQPITLDGEGRILDGRNRYAACQLAGVEPRFETYEGADPDGLALSANLVRRNLTTGARALIAAQAVRLNGSSTREAAKRYKLYQSRIAEADVVLDYAPEYVPQIIAGATPLSVALPKAREGKKKAEDFRERLAKLRDKASDLADLVAEGRMDVDEATAALDQREHRAAEEAAEQARKEAEEASAASSPGWNPRSSPTMATTPTDTRWRSTWSAAASSHPRST